MLSGWKEHRAAMIADAVRGMAGRPRPGTEPGWAVATVRGLSSPGVFDELVRGEAWSPDQYEEWLASLLARLLLEP